MDSLVEIAGSGGLSVIVILLRDANGFANQPTDLQGHAQTRNSAPGGCGMDRNEDVS
jgi:hypothetical protein